jgi:energy-coupling factor transport system ATP-binding protein
MSGRSGESPLVSVRDLSHVYLAGTPMQTQALRGAELAVREGEIAALIGENGAGKSTLLRFLNGLLRPSVPGRVLVFGQDTASPDCDLAALRQDVGLVFQAPHQQLFERFVGDDVAYGPRQLGLQGEALRERVRWAMGVVGLDFGQFKDRHTFSLSGGEMRRAALAGVLAMRPRLLVLDEATTGLDPRGKREVHQLLRRLRQEEGTTILIASNDMDEVAGLADAVTVLHAGRTVLAGTTREVFTHRDGLEQYGMLAPTAVSIVRALVRAGVAIDAVALTATEAEEAIWRAMTR